MQSYMWSLQFSQTFGLKCQFEGFLRLLNHDFAASSPIDFAMSSPIDFAASSPPQKKLGHITSSSRGTKMACTLIQYRKIHRVFLLVLIEDRGPHLDLFLKNQVQQGAGVHKNVNCLRDFFSSDKLSKKVRDIRF